jgi:alpha,alpha-trehalase
MELKSAIFDMDGVITDTASIHFKAWKQIFDSYLQEQSLPNGAGRSFSHEDYLQYVDGMSRMDGVKRFLYSRGLIHSVEKPTKEEDQIVQKIADEKNEVFLELLDKDGVKVFESTIQLVKELKKHQVTAAVISSSKNCRDILTRANVIDLFDVLVDGQELARFNLKGKPAPDIFLEAAKRSNSKPQESIVVEDALSGVMAGKAGHFGLVIGIDRDKNHFEQYKKEGADIVVSDLSEIQVDQIKEELKKNIPVLLDNIEEFAKHLKGKHLILFTDFDGTLTPIAQRPELAILSNEMIDVLYQLKQFCSIVVVSGRELSDVEEKVAINGLYYAGNHGFEIVGPEHFATKFEIGQEYLDVIRVTYEQLAEDLAGFENCIIENKHLSLSIHYRLVDPQQVPIIEQIVQNYAAHNPKLAMHYGKKVFEIRPNINWNKGKALEYILDKLKEDNCDYLPIYLGDDITDEDAFLAVKDLGLGILVSEHPKISYATYRINNPQKTYELLKTILLVIRAQQNLSHLQHNWSLTYTDYEPEQEKLREALCTLGNGYFATRGALDTCHADAVHYPGTYFAGCYNRLKSVIRGEEVFNEDLVNMPNWLPMMFKVNEGDWFGLKTYELLEYKQQLNLHKGILSRLMRVRDREGRVSQLEFFRFVSMANPHLAVQRFTIKPENWSGKIMMQSGIDGSVINDGVARYQELNSKHLEVLKIESSKNNELGLLMRTSQSHIEVAYTATHYLYLNHKPVEIDGKIKLADEAIYQFIYCDLEQGKKMTLEKRVTVATNKDTASSDSLTDTRNLTAYVNQNSYSDLLDAHLQIWKSLWKRCDIKITAEGEDQRILRLHIFHLLQTISKNSIDLDIGVPARGLHGESYRGHIFWDEVFIIPFYTFYFPEMARALLMYRFRRLTMARHLASRAGYRGAMYPWQSGSNGDEVTQLIHLNPRSNQWLPDYSHYQRHVNAAIVYNIWQYYLISNDKSFLTEFGAEMILEIARFWASIASYNSNTHRYEIRHVVGPDEYHEKYPSSNEPGINNNAYTNIMAVWSIERALEILEILETQSAQELMDLLHISNEEIVRWQDITTAMTVPFHEDGIISQFEGYEQLAEFDWDLYLKKYGNIERLDRILKAENDSPDNYKVSKQADVLMLFYLLPFEELQTILTKLGYKFDQDMLSKNINYYLKRTSHGSTLSKVVFSSLYRYIGEELAGQYYHDVLNSDLMDLQGGTTAEGVHLGAMASCININLFRFAGVAIKHHILSFDPKLPSRITQLQFNLQYHHQWLHVKIEKNTMTVILKKDGDKPLPIYINEHLYYLQPNDELEVVLES